ncbi:hypothetical protein PYCC9005_003677 [Savitreella phatthalungensis]
MLDQLKRVVKKEVALNPAPAPSTLNQVDAPIADKDFLGEGQTAVATPTEEPSSPQFKAIDPDEKELERTLTAPDGSDPTEYQHGFKLATIVLALFLSVFLVALDQSILSTAIPKIADRFNSLEDLPFYVSAYLLTTCALIPTWGKVYQNFNVKYGYLVAVSLFEIGSAVCGAAPTSKALIIGRAIAGCGTAGIFSGGLVILSRILPLERRAAFMGGFAACFGIASVCGPLMGGAFTDNPHLTWRWCFYVNLPFGAVTLAAIGFFVRLKSLRQTETVRERLRNIDPLGAAVLLPAVVSLLLALQWGGSKYEWSNWRIILLFIVFGVLAIVFAGLQLWLGDRATIPPNLLKKRTIWTGALVAVFFAGFFFGIATYIPLYFEAVRGSSAIKAGLQLLPFMISVVLSSMAGGILVQVLGVYVPILIVGIVPTIIGMGLITTFSPDTPSRMWIGYQIIAGMGAGCCFQIPIIASQVVLKPDEIPVGTSIITFSQNLGGAIWISVAQSIFQNTLKRHLLAETNGDMQFANTILSAGATKFREFLPESSPLFDIVIRAYMAGLRGAYHVGLIAISICVLWACLMPWKRIEKGTNVDHAAAA